MDFPRGPMVAAAAAKSLQSWLTLGDLTDSRPPGSPIPGILQARTLEWVAISFSNAPKEVSRDRVLLGNPMFLPKPEDKNSVVAYPH